MSTDETMQAIEAWRKLKQAQLAETPSRRTHAAQIALLRDALNTAERHLLPPVVGLNQQLAEIVANWRTTWTTELRQSGIWQTAKLRLHDIRQLVDNGKLDDAVWEVQDIFLRGCAGARKFSTAGQVRALSDVPDTPQPSRADAEEGLRQLLDWMSRI